MPFPTNAYPRVLYSGSLSVEAALPIVNASPAFQTAKAENFAASGVRETVVIRREPMRTLAFGGVEPLETEQWGRFLDGHANAGRQFELLVDRFTGPVVTFVNTIKDQDVAGVASATVVTSYASVSNQTGLLNAGSQRVVVRNNVGSENQTLVHSQGCTVLTMACSFVPSGNTTYFWAVASNEATIPNMLALSAGSGMVRLDYRTSAGSLWTRAVSLTWPSGAVVTLLAQWQAARSLDLWVTVQGSATVTATFDAAGSAGIPGSLSTLANTVTLLSHVAGSSPANGILLLAGFYRAAYADPSLLSSHFPLGQNYYSKAEALQATAFVPVRQNPSVDLWDFSFMIRQGF